MVMPSPLVLRFAKPAPTLTSSPGRGSPISLFTPKLRLRSSWTRVFAIRARAKLADATAVVETERGTGGLPVCMLDAGRR